jgi:hypothetical protein
MTDQAKTSNLTSRLLSELALAITKNPTYNIVQILYQAVKYHQPSHDFKFRYLSNSFLCDALSKWNKKDG